MNTFSAAYTNTIGSRSHIGLRGVFLAVGFIFCHLAFAQDRSGITGIPDTSFNLNSAWQASAKNHPEIRKVSANSVSGVIEKHDIAYCDVSYRQLKLDVFYPANSKTTGHKTGIIIIHGGGWRSGSRSLHYPMARQLASRGYVCFLPEYRLSTEALFPAAIYDLKSAVRWVRDHTAGYGINPNQIVAVGHSAGGELAAFLGSTGNLNEFNAGGCMPETRATVNAVVDIDGILAFLHPESGEGDDSRHKSAATYWFGFAKEEQPALWRNASPLTHAGPDSAPILFLNSSVERMHAGRDDYISILKSHGIYTEVHTFNKAPHSFCLFDPWFSETINLIDAFIQKLFPI